MRRALPASLIAPGHPDYDVLSELAGEIARRAGGLTKLRQQVPLMLRECIDEILQTPRTRRRSYAEMEKVEKTYIGTRVEIRIRDLLDAPKGKLDLRLCGLDVDVKHTMGSNWMIPTEALEHVCILIAANEKRAWCSMGLIYIRPEYLTDAANKDGKRTLRPEAFANILWLINAEPYPANFWRSLQNADVDRIFARRAGNDALGDLFRTVQDRPVPRAVLEAAAPQSDFTRRARSDKRRSKGGTRDVLLTEGILLLSGNHKRAQGLIEKFGLPSLARSEWMSHQVASAEEAQIARSFGYDVAWPIS